MFKKYFSLSLKKTILIISLIPISWFFDKSEFPKIDAFIRDAFQYLNDTSEVDKSLVTININAKNDDFKRPFDLEEVKSLINKIIEHEPKIIILCFSLRELNYDEAAAKNFKPEFFEYLKDKKNIYLHSSGDQSGNDILIDPILSKYPRIIDLVLSQERQFGAKDYKRRRAFLTFDKTGNSPEFEILNNLGLNTKTPDFYKYKIDFWGSKYAYLKTYLPESYGSLDASQFIKEKNNLNLKDKIIILSSNDEYSDLGAPSVFHFFDTEKNKRFTRTSQGDALANHFNFYITGKYIKYLLNPIEVYITLLLLILLILVNVDQKVKIYLFILSIPSLIAINAIIYASTSFYLDFSRSIALLITIQYFAIPIVMLNIFKEQETKKLQEINDARIDALLTISEKVAHDIRSPLSAINLVMSRAKFEDQQFKEVFDGAVKRIDETATKILQKYRTNHNNNEHNHAIEILPIIDKIIKEKAILNNKIQIVLSNNLSNTSALGSSLDIERIISNIIDNSLYALKEQAHPKIQITITTDNEYLIIDLKDNGVGIPERILNIVGHERVTTKSENNEGNGIGLLHAKRTIEQMDGKFVIESKENLGTTIKIYLKKV